MLLDTTRSTADTSALKVPPKNIQKLSTILQLQDFILGESCPSIFGGFRRSRNGNMCTRKAPAGDKETFAPFKIVYFRDSYRIFYLHIASSAAHDLQKIINYAMLEIPHNISFKLPATFAHGIISQS